MRQEEKEVHIAPMLHVSTPEFRFFMRLLTRSAVLWTEMVVDEFLVHCEKSQYDVQLEYCNEEHPIICQIGGNHPEWAKQAAHIVRQYGFDQVNLNCGCPSRKVASTREFGAALMKQPTLIQDMIANISDAFPEPSIKLRIGVDDQDSLEFIVSLIQQLQPYCQRFILHARKAYTKGLNAEQNRRVPPLNYPLVYELCHRFPDCQFWINGGIQTLQEAFDICYGKGSIENSIHHQSIPCRLCNAPFGSCLTPPVVAPLNLKGCMLGRAAIDRPAIFGNLDQYFYGRPNPCRNRRESLQKYCEYLEERYPRRCCDNDVRITSRHPAPNVSRYQDYCTVCKEVYSEFHPGIKLKASVSVVPESMTNDTPPKISSPVMSRSLRPVLGIFSSCKNAQLFRRECGRWGGDARVRNCGPGFVLRLALRVVPDDVLDREFGDEELP